MARITVLLAILPFLTSFAAAMFPNDMFEQMFQQGGHHHHHHQQQQQNAPSNSDHYQREFDHVQCDKYLCPGTLACVHFPHHCPCAFPNVEDKVELGDGIAVCASKGGYKPGEMARKVELARKGLL